MLLIIMAAIILTAKAIQVKRYRLIPVCVFALLYDVAVRLYVYPPDALMDYLQLTSWAEHILFILFIAGVGYASVGKKPSGISVERIPVILAAVTAVLRVGKMVYSKLIFAQMKTGKIPTEDLFDTVNQGAAISNLLMRCVQLLVYLILLEYIFSYIRKNRKENEDQPTV